MVLRQAMWSNGWVLTLTTGALLLALSTAHAQSAQPEPLAPAVSSSSSASSGVPAAPELPASSSSTASSGLPAATPEPAPGTNVKVVSSGSKEAEKGTAVGKVGRSEGYQDTRVSDRTPNVWGQTGLMRLTSARAGKGGYFDFSLHGRAFYTAEQLFILSNGPVFTDCARSKGRRNCDTYIESYLWGAGAFGVTVFDYVELSLAGTGSGNENSETNPRVLVSTGNVAASMKLSIPVVVWTRKLPELLKLQKPVSYFFPVPLAFGVDFRAYLPSRVGALGSAVDNVNLSARALATLDLYEGRGWPFRAHLNAGYAYQSPFSIERSIALRALARDDSRILRGAEGAAAAVAADYSYFDLLTYGAGIELPFPFVTPFVEYTGEIPVPMPSPLKAGLPGNYAGTTPLGKNGNVLLDPFAWPSRITPGIRITPGRGLAFDIAADVGVFGRTTITDGLVTQLPWSVFGGISYTFSPFVAETEVEIREVEKRVEVTKTVSSVKSGGRIAGSIVDASTGKPIPDAILNFPGAGPDILAEEDGRYESYTLDPGFYEVVAEAIDYDEATGTVEVQAGQVSKLDLRLTPHPRAASFKATVINEKDQSVPATITLTDSKGATFNMDAKEGTGEAELPPGRYNAVAKAEGYLLSGKPVVIEAGVKTAETFLLKAEPKKRLTVLTRERIEIKSTIHFEYNKARLLTASSFILDEVVDTLLKNPQIEKMRVEGHTDNTGDPEYNQRLSQARAEAVREYLVHNGVAAERADAVGYGDTRPLAPNTTEAGRARNRRVEFVIVQPDAPAEGGEAPAQTPVQEGGN